jgi:hypothetical protein
MVSAKRVSKQSVSKKVIQQVLSEIAVPEIIPFGVELGKGQKQRRSMMILSVIGEFGLNAQMEIDMHVAALSNLSYGGGGVRKPIDALVNQGVLEKETLRIKQDHKHYVLALLRLSKKGKDSCQKLGLPVTTSEWERLLKYYPHPDQTNQVFQILYFSVLARARAYSVEILPVEETGIFKPDLKLTRQDERHCVKMVADVGAFIQADLSQLKDDHGCVSICTWGMKERLEAANILKQAGIAGRAADIQTLKGVRIYESDHKTPLWLEMWN